MRRVAVAALLAQRLVYVAVAVAVAAGTAIAAPVVGSSRSMPAVVYHPKRETVSAVFHLTPRLRSASISRLFVHADVGIDSFRLTLPRGLHAELLSRNPVESVSGQAPSKTLCVPYRLCRDAGRTALRFCRDSGPETICGYVTDGGAPFAQGRWTLTVRELEPRRARVRLRVTFIRGPGA